MKPDIHPEYRFVVFRDISVDFQFLTRSTIDEKNFKETVEIDGEEYPVVNVDISAASHPFYTGTQKLMDSEGRVERYYRKYGFRNPRSEEGEEAEASPEAAPEAAPEGEAAAEDTSES